MQVAGGKGDDSLISLKPAFIRSMCSPVRLQIDVATQSAVHRQHQSQLRWSYPVPLKLVVLGAEVLGFFPCGNESANSGNEASDRCTTSKSTDPRVVVYAFRSSPADSIAEDTLVFAKDFEQVSLLLEV